MLTASQLCVLRHLCEGKTSQQIADELFVSKRTVEFHIRSIYNRLNVSNRVQALREAQRLGLLALV
jgi:DNA-binding NarL/FixJ family response regulator